MEDLTMNQAKNGDDTQQTAATPKKSSKIGIIALIICAIVGLALGFALSSGVFSDRAEEPKTFAVSGMEITLTGAFKETQMDPYLQAYDSKNVAVFVTREAIAEFVGADTLSLTDYALLVMQANSRESSELLEQNGIPYITYDYTNEELGVTYRYFCYMYKSNAAFWVIQFATPVTEADAMAPQIAQWANSVTFND